MLSRKKLVFRQGHAHKKSGAHQRSCCAVMHVAARATGHMTGRDKFSGQAYDRLLAHVRPSAMSALGRLSRAKQTCFAHSELSRC
jgi:hypothetical protein